MLLESFRFEDENYYETTMSKKLNLKFRQTRKLHCTFFFSRKVSTVIYIEEVKPSLDRKMIKLLTFDNSFPPLRH